MDEAVYILNSANTLGKGMNLPPAIGEIVGLTSFFSNGRQLIKEKENSG